MAVHGSPEGLAEWLAARDYPIPEGAPEANALLQRATDYINGLYGPRLIGDQTADPLLTALANATYAAALYEAQNPGGLTASVAASAAVKREKVGVLEVEYVAGSGDVISDSTVRLSLVEGYLAPFLRPEDGAGCLGVWAVG